MVCSLIQRSSHATRASSPGASSCKQTCTVVHMLFKSVTSLHHMNGDMADAKLTYFAGRGRVEVVRLLLASAGLKVKIHGYVIQYYGTVHYL